MANKGKIRSEKEARFEFPNGICKEDLPCRWKKKKNADGLYEVTLNGILLEFLEVGAIIVSATSHCLLPKIRLGQIVRSNELLWGIKEGTMGIVHEIIKPSIAGSVFIEVHFERHLSPDGVKLKEIDIVR